MDVDGCNHGDHNDDGDGGPGAPGDSELATLVENLRRAERLLAQVVVDAGRLASAGVAERDAGQPLELLLGTACRQMGADRATLITAGEVIADMPVLRGMFLDGEVSWGQVRAITRLVRRRSRADRAWLDEQIGATFVRHEGDLDKVEPMSWWARPSGPWMSCVIWRVASATRPTRSPRASWPSSRA